jgi:hypothetical protein
MNDLNHISPLDDDFPGPTSRPQERAASASPKKATTGTSAGSSGGEQQEPVPGRRLGIVGFPNSGKTSWLYALVNGHKHYSIRRGGAGHARGQRSWLMGALDGKFAALIGQEGTPQPATPRGFFKSSRFCEMKRPWIPGLPLATRFWLHIPEVAGETVRAIADGGSYLNAADKKAAQDYLDFLCGCDSILGLVGIDGDGRGDARSVDESLAKIQGFERVLSHAIERRVDKRHPIAVTVLITKIDLIKSSASLDEIEIPRDRSSIGALAGERGYEALAEEIRKSGSDELTVRFRVNPLLRSRVATGDLRIQECLAADFLRCHAPQAALQMKRLCDEIPGLDVRFYLCAPYGQSSRNADNEAVFPTSGALKPTMIYEPLEELLERSWKMREGSRLRRRLMVCAFAAVLLLVFGPILAWSREDAFDRSIEDGASLAEVRRNLDSVESHWLFGLEQAVSEERAKAHARRLIDLRVRMGEAKESSQDIARVEDRAYELDPGASILIEGRTVPLRDRISVRTRRELEDYLAGVRGAAPASVDLPVQEVAQLSAFLETLAAGVRPAAEWEQMGQRLQSINLLNGGGSCKLIAAEGGAGLTSSFRKLEAAAKLKSRMNDLQSRETQELLRLVDHAARAGDVEALRQIDAVLARRWKEEWTSSLLLEKTETPLGGVEAFLASSSNGLPSWAHPMKREFARSVVDDRIRGFMQSSAEVARDLRFESDKAKRLEGLGNEIDRLRDFKSDVEALRRSQPWVITGLGKGLEDVVEWLGQRQQLIQGTGRVDANPAVAGEVVREFLGEEPVDSVVYEPLSGSRIPLKFGDLASIQRDSLVDWLDRKSVSLIGEGDIKGARAVLDAKRELQGTPAGTEENLISSAEELAKAKPDTERLGASLQALLREESALATQGSILVRSLEGAPAFEIVAPIVLRCIASDQNGANGAIKREWADRIMAGMPAAAWINLSAAQLGEVQSALVDVGWTPSSAAARLMRPLVDQYAAAQGVGARKALLETMVAVYTKAIARAQKDGQGVDMGIEVFDGALRAVRDHYRNARTVEDFAPSKQGMELLAMLKQLLARGVKSDALSTIVAGAERHAGLVVTWKLVKLTPEAGAGGAQIAPYWLSPREWTTTDVEKIAQTNSAAFERIVQGNPDLPFTASGTLRRAPMGAESLQNLQLTDPKHAEEIAEVGGLRLPTKAEWILANSRFQNGVPRWNANADLKTRGDCSPAALEKLGDKQRDGIIGLTFGVREWVGEGELMGRSNLQAEAEAPRQQVFDSGLRPALDGTPREFDAIK